MKTSVLAHTYTSVNPHSYISIRAFYSSLLSRFNLRISIQDSTVSHRFTAPFLWEIYGKFTILTKMNEFIHLNKLIHDQKITFHVVLFRHPGWESNQETCLSYDDLHLS